MMGTILIVDNHPDVMASTRALLDMEGFRVITATSPQAAKEIMAKQWIHLAIIDLRLTHDADEHDRSGLVLLQETDPIVPTIMLTAFPDWSITREALAPDLRGRSRAVDFIYKKEGPQALLSAVEEAFAEHVRINFDLEIRFNEPLSLMSMVSVLGDLPVEGEELVLLSEELSDLFRKLFHDAIAITVYPLPHGHDGGATVQVRAVSEAGIMMEPVIVKYGLREKIGQEATNYDQYVVGLASYRSTQKLNFEETLHFAAIAYSVLGRGLQELIRFTDYYRSSDSSEIARVLDHLFKETCRHWYEGSRRLADEPMDVWYRRHLSFGEKQRQELDKAIEALCQESLSLGMKASRERLKRSVTFDFGDGLVVSFPDPVDFIYRADQLATPSTTIVSINHGDLNGNNILVDQYGGTWLVDFARTGWGPVLRDFAELETVIKFQLLQTRKVLDLYEFEKALLGAERFDVEIAIDPKTPEDLEKAVQVIGHLRKIAGEIAGTDLREYYIGLLFYALRMIVAGGVSSPRQPRPGLVRKGHALLSAAMIAYRLGHWADKWEGWPEARKTLVSQPEVGNVAVASRFFEAAGFEVEPVMANALAVRNPKARGWRDFSDILVRCFDEGEGITSEHVRLVLGDIQKLALSDKIAFAVHSGQLEPGAATALWRLKKDGLVVIPVHTLMMKRGLATGDPDECYRQLRSLREIWSLMVDPYETVDSVTDPQWFIGRTELIQEIMGHIGSGKQIVLWGMRRVGKTAVLNQIELTCRGQGYPVVKWLCKREPVELILYNIINGFAGSVGKLYPRAGPVEVAPLAAYQQNAAEHFKADLSKLWNAVRQGSNPDVKFVLLLDELEIEGFFPGEKSSEDDYLRYINFAQAIKDVLERGGAAEALSLVVAAEYPWANDINQFPYNGKFKNPLFKRFTPKLLTFLKRPECDTMVQKIGELAGLQYDPTSLEHIYSETRGHPQVTRWLCSCILAVMEQDGARGGVIAKIVDHAVDYFLGEPGGDSYRSYFEQVFWQNPLSPDVDNDQRVLAELATRDPYPADELLPRLLKQFGTPEDRDKEGMQSARVAIENAVKRLVELSVVNEDRRRNVYRLRVPLYAQWIRVWKLGSPAKLRGGGHAS